jgi:CRISPR-associated endoribonuclease Cas6
VRLKILLELQKPVLIPWDYRTSLTRAVYEILALSDAEYSRWLHDEGFRRGNKVYRLFVYSDLQPQHCAPEKEGLRISQWLTWQVASPDSRFIERFIDGIGKKNHRLSLFQNSCEIVDILCMKLSLSLRSLTSATISPIVASTYNPGISRHPIYLSPDQPEFTQALEKNLIAKWEAFHEKHWNSGEFSIRVWDPKNKLVHVFDTNIRAWHLKIQMWGSEELVRFAYDAGLGEKNSQGFGMLKVGR